MEKLQKLVEELDIIHVYDCRGTVLCNDWKELPQGVRLEKVPNFQFPVPADFELDEEAKRLAEEVLWVALRRAGGAINWSGVYPFTQDCQALLLRALTKQLKVADIGEIAARVLEALRQNPQHALLCHSSGWRCASICRGYHRQEFVYYDSEGRWKRFAIGAHHACFEGMWDIEPHSISEEEALRLVKERVEHEFEEAGAIYEHEKLEAVAYIRDDASKLDYCHEHERYYFEDEDCEECREARLDSYVRDLCEE